MLRIAIISLLLFASSQSFCFGSKGHQIIALIAQEHLTHAAHTAVTEILDGESLTSASTWADRMRSSKDSPVFWSYDYAANWHFINIAAGEDYSSSSKSNKGDAYIALLSFIDLLNHKPLTNSPVKDGLTVYRGKAPQQQLALKFLIHLVGDLHQPLHVGYLEDKGGNNIKIKWFNKSTNLHSIWDTRLIEHSDLSSQQISSRLLNQINTMPSSRALELASSSIEQWLVEAIELRTEVYDVGRYKGKLNSDYANRYAPVIEQQLLKAGLRLAHTLNSIYTE